MGNLDNLLIDAIAERVADKLEQRLERAPKCWTVEQAAKAMGLSTETVYKLVESNAIEAYRFKFPSGQRRIIRVPISEFDKFKNSDQ